MNEKRSFDRDAFGKSYVVSSGSNHPLLRKLEEEKEDALAKIRNLQLERDELLRQIQVTMMMAMTTMIIIMMMVVVVMMMVEVMLMMMMVMMFMTTMI